MFFSDATQGAPLNGHDESNKKLANPRLGLWFAVYNSLRLRAVVAPVVPKKWGVGKGHNLFWEPLTPGYVPGSPLASSQKGGSG